LALIVSSTVEPLLKDPPRKGQCIHYLSTRDVLKTTIFLLY